MKKIFSIFAAILFAGSMMAGTMSVDFESAASSYSNWTITTIKTQQSASDVNAHGGSYFGSTDGKTTGSIITKDKVEPTSITFWYSKLSTNTKAASWIVKVSTDGTNWTEVESKAAGNGVTKGTWYEFTTDLSSYSDVYVGVFYDGNTAARCLDDLVLTVVDADPDQPSLSVSPTAIEFGTVEQGEEVAAQEVEVTFANLTGSVTYSGLTAPFSASGAVAATGDKISIAANTAEIGEYSQTLTITSADDAKSATVTVTMKVVAPSYHYQATFDCATAFSNFAEWGNSYAEHSVSNADAQLVLASACHQTGTITDVPVTKGGDVELIITNTEKELSAVKFVCRQWGTKAQTMTLSYSEDGGETYSAFDPAITSTEFVIEQFNLPSGINAVKVSFSEAANQVGIVSVSYDLADKSPTPVDPTAIENAAVEVKAVKVIENGQMFIIKDGVRYNALGTMVK